MKEDQSYLPNIIIISNFLYLLKCIKIRSPGHSFIFHIYRKYQATRVRIRDATFVFFLILCRCNLFYGGRLKCLKKTRYVDEVY